MLSTIFRWIAVSFAGALLLHVSVYFACAISGHRAAEQSQWPGPWTRLTPAELAAIEAGIDRGDRQLAMLSPGTARGVRLERIGYEEVRFRISHGMGIDLEADGPMRFEPLEERILLRRVAVGWPTKCFRFQSVEREIEASDVRLRQGPLSSITDDPLSAFYDIVYPTTPIWRGIAVNSLIYFVIAFAVVFLLRFNPVRRRLRLRRGLCPKCAYPIGTNERCTECGEKLPEDRRP